MVEIRLLGAVEAVVDGVVRGLGHARQRCVLAGLAVDVNRPVGYDQLVHRVWGGTPPPRPRAALYGYLYRLRRLLAGARGVALVRGPGYYQLTAPPDVVDLHRFELVVESARRTGDDARRVELYDDALALWRGTAFTGLDTPWLDDVRAVLEQRRHLAERHRTEAALRLGRCDEVVADLVARTRAHPFDEHLAAQLMLALHGMGRTAEAFTVHRAMCGLLAEELGTGPGEALRAAHDRLLRTPVGG
ncbi:MAG TPA: BTAD domain-containing putative transcriptional regulator [Umezawaea sp.]|nr:BTAD domain-containing putative transcriptional regulator [Umezawaea sp.]